MEDDKLKAAVASELKNTLESMARNKHANLPQVEVLLHQVERMLLDRTLPTDTLISDLNQPANSEAVYFLFKILNPGGRWLKDSLQLYPINDPLAKALISFKGLMDNSTFNYAVRNYVTACFIETDDENQLVSILHEKGWSDAEIVKAVCTASANPFYKQFPQKSRRGNAASIEKVISPFGRYLLPLLPSKKGFLGLTKEHGLTLLVDGIYKEGYLADRRIYWVSFLADYYPEGLENEIEYLKKKNYNGEYIDYPILYTLLERFPLKYEQLTLQVINEHNPLKEVRYSLYVQLEEALPKKYHDRITEIGEDHFNYFRSTPAKDHYRYDPYTIHGPLLQAYTEYLWQLDEVNARVRLLNFIDEAVFLVDDFLTFIEKKLGASSLSPIPYIDFQTKNYVNGIYDLKVVLVAAAGTGSLADSKGLEEITKTHHYVVVVDKTPPLTLQVTAQVEDGMLRIRWPQHVRKNFQKYILTKTYSISRDVYNQCWSMDITSQQQTFFSDSTYVGGKVRYSLQVKAADQLSTPTTTSFELNYSPDINTVWMNKDQVKLVWRKNPLFRSLSQYKITLRSSSATPFAIFNTPDTTAVVANRFLFPANRARIDIIPKGKECPSSNTYQEKIIIMGEPFPAFKDANIRYSVPFSKYFAMRDNGTQHDLMRISEQGVIEQYITVSDDHFYLSPDGRLMYTAIGSLLSQLDPLTFTVIRSFDLRSLVAGSSIGVVGGAVNISNDNRIAITTSKGNFVLDASFAVLKSSPQDTKMEMSASGNSLVTNNALWLWDGSTYVMKYSQFPVNSYFGFRGDQYLVITSSDNNLVKLLDTTTLVLETSNNTAFIPGPGSYDPVSGWSSRLAADASDLNVLVLILYKPDGSTVGKIPVQWGDMNRGFATVLSNNHIICSNGYSLPLSFYYP